MSVQKPTAGVWNQKQRTAPGMNAIAAGSCNAQNEADPADICADFARSVALLVPLQLWKLLRFLLRQMRSTRMKPSASLMLAFDRPVLPVPPARSRSLIRPNC